MSLAIEMMTKVIDKCDVVFDNCIISKELLLRTFADFITMTIEERKHNFSIVLHTGSICYDALLLIYAVISNIFYNETTTEDLIKSLEEGDVVLYYADLHKSSNEKNKMARFKYQGMQSDEGKTYVKLGNGKGESYSVPHHLWHFIAPYKGESLALDGKGIRRDSGKRDTFFKFITDGADIGFPRVIDKSTIIIASKERADRLVKNLSLEFNGEKVDLTELVPVSYYHNSENSIPYGKNPSKVESVIKFVSRPSVARKLIRNRDGNRHVGLILLEEDKFKKAELDSHLIDNEAIQYVYLSLHIDSESTDQLLSNKENANLFVCTKDFLLSNSLPPAETNRLTAELYEQINAVIDSEVNVEVVSSSLSWGEYKDFKQRLKNIKRSDLSIIDKDTFLRESYSLMNLLLTAVFPLKLFDDLIDEGVVDSSVRKIEYKVSQIEDLAENLPTQLSDEAFSVVEVLKTLYESLRGNNSKVEIFLKLLRKGIRKRIAVIVPKRYHVAIVEKMIGLESSLATRKVKVFTLHNFDNMQLYDQIIVVGNIKGKSFDPLRCKSSQDIRVLLYDVENSLFQKRVMDAHNTELVMNKRSTIPVEMDSFDGDELIQDFEESSDIAAIENELRDYINSSEQIIKNIRSSNSGNHLSKVVCCVSFCTGEKSLLTKNYRAYTLREGDNEINENEPKDLIEGDTLIFTRSGSRNRDVVEEIIERVLEENVAEKNMKQIYENSRRWKNVLIEYKDRTGKSINDIAKDLANYANVQENTVRCWLDEESYIVRPQQLESIQQIALFVGDDAFFNEAEDCYSAGNRVYEFRREILRLIADIMLSEAIGSQLPLDPLTQLIASQFDHIAVMLKIDSISYIEDEVPSNYTNRPLDIE